MQFNIPHKQTAWEATQRVKRALEEARANIPDDVKIEREEWEGYTLHFAFTAQGQHIKGTFEVQDRAFVINATLPLMLRIFEGRIKQAIEEQVKGMLSAR